MNCHGCKYLDEYRKGPRGSGYCCMVTQSKFFDTQVKGADKLECRQVCEEHGENGCKGCPIALAFDRLAAYEDTGLTPEEVQQMRRISVEERLPDKPGHYLVCTNVNYWHGGCMDKNGASSNAGTTDGYAGTTLSVLDCFYDITGDWNRVCNAHVTHWMPLPAAPKEEAYEK